MKIKDITILIVAYKSDDILLKNLSNLNNKERYVSLLPLDLSLESKLKTNNLEDIHNYVIDNYRL